MKTSDYSENKTFFEKVIRYVIVAVSAVAFLGILFFFVYFHVDTVEVMGSSYYSEVEIKEMVLRGPMATNSVLASRLYSRGEIEDIPFIEAIDVSQVNNHTIIISVKETDLVGCIKYLDCYMYFDRQGLIVASSVNRDLRVPYFEGLEVESVSFGEEIPFANDGLLNTAISLTRIFAKADDLPSHIVLDSEGDITLYYEDIVAQLGQDRYLEDKMTRLLAILPKIAGQKGILHLENVNQDRKTITFERELTPTEQAALENQEEDSEEESDELYEDSYEDGYDDYSSYDDDDYD